MRITSEKIAWFERVLSLYGRKAGRTHLPWRRSGITPYEVWVSEIMLQQTQVTRVISYYERFLKRFPTVEKLARASWEEFLPYYEGLGYYARGRNMLRAARAVVEEYGGVFPREREALQKLPGVGPYTAAAILSFAYDSRHLAWDTNLKRVFGRVFFGSRAATFDPEAFESRLVGSRKRLNAALMDFGSSVCVARPKCGICPLSSRCRYFREGGRGEVRAVRPQPAFPLAEAQALVFLHENHRRYFSAAKTRFTPFLVPKTHADRAGIKSWFRERYGLDLSVRPPHRTLFVRKKPTLLVNAQILLGTPAFPVFSKKEAREYTERELSA